MTLIYESVYEKIMFDDVGCYFLPFIWSLTEAYLDGSYIYSPAFMGFFYPFTLIPVCYFYIFHIIGCLCLVKVLWKFPWWFQLAIFGSEISHIWYGNMDVWITVLLLAWYSHIKQHSFLTGCLIGLCCFKPPVILVALFVWKKVEIKPFLLGLAYCLSLNYGYFLFDMSALTAFLQASLMRNHSMGSLYLIPTHYGWFLFYFDDWMNGYSNRLQKLGCGFIVLTFPYTIFYIVKIHQLNMKDPNRDRKININQNNRSHLGSIKKAQKTIKSPYMQKIIIDSHKQNLK